MDRTTILLPTALRKNAAKRAATLGISLGELIRRKLSEELGGKTTASKRRMSDPLFNNFEELESQGGGKDVSLNHDSYLYDN